MGTRSARRVSCRWRRSGSPAARRPGRRRARPADRPRTRPVRASARPSPPAGTITSAERPLRETSRAGTPATGATTFRAPSCFRPRTTRATSAAPAFERASPGSRTTASRLEPGLLPLACAINVSALTLCAAGSWTPSLDIRLVTVPPKRIPRRVKATAPATSRARTTRRQTTEQRQHAPEGSATRAPSGSGPFFSGRQRKRHASLFSARERRNLKRTCPARFGSRRRRGLRD